MADAINMHIEICMEKCTLWRGPYQSEYEPYNKFAKYFSVYGLCNIYRRIDDPLT